LGDRLVLSILSKYWANLMGVCGKDKFIGREICQHQ